MYFFLMSLKILINSHKNWAGYKYVTLPKKWKGNVYKYKYKEVQKLSESLTIVSYRFLYSYYSFRRSLAAFQILSFQRCDAVAFL